MNRLYQQTAFMAARGFTLLEIMLVLVIMAVITAMVIPNLFVSPAAALEDEAHYLKRLLMLTADEAQLTGVPMRWTADITEYRFSSIDDEGIWQPVQDKPFGTHVLPAGVEIQEVSLQGHVSNFKGRPDEANDEEESSLGHVIFFPDGMLSLADIALNAEGATLHIHVRPGIGGIQLEH